MKNKLITAILAMLVSFFCSQVFLISVNTGLSMATHPAKTLIIRFILFIIIVCLIALKRREYVVYFFLIAFPFLRLSFNGIPFITLFAVTLALLYAGEIKHFIKSEINVFGFPFILIAIAMVISTSMARYRGEAASNIVLVMSYYAVFLVLNVFLTNQNRIIAFFHILMFTVIFAAFVYVIQFLFGVNSVKLFFGEYNQNIEIYSSMKRVPSFFVEAQTAGLFFAFMSCFCASLSKIMPRNRLILNLLAGICFVMLIFNTTRIAIIAFIIGLIVSNMLAINLRKICLFLVIVFTLIFFWNPLYVHLPRQIKVRFQNSNIEESSSFRFRLWRDSLPIIIHNPLGVGMGGFNLYDAGREVGATFRTEFLEEYRFRRSTHFENTYLTIMYSLGVLGIGGFFGIIAVFFYHGVRLLRKRAANASLIGIIIPPMIVWMTCVFTSPLFYDSQIMLLFVYFIALMNILVVKPDIQISDQGR